MSTLFEDFRLVRPTEAVMFPRVFEMIHRHFLGEVARRVAAGEVDVDGVREQVMDEMRYTFLGDRIASIFAGSAPTTPEIRRFVSACFPVTYAEGYGTTEAGGSVTVRDRINRSEVLDYRLRDVPELGYYSTDKPVPARRAVRQDPARDPRLLQEPRGHRRAVRRGRFRAHRRHHGGARARPPRLRRPPQRRAQTRARRVRHARARSALSSRRTAT